MLIQRIKRLMLSWLVVCLMSVGLAAVSDPAWAKDISWRATTVVTAGEGNRFTREGTAVFMTGEEAHVVINLIQGQGSSWASGTSTADAVYRFKDGSGFTLRFEGSWNGAGQRGAGTFVDGIGRFAGMTGGATATGEMPTTGPTAVIWTGTYEVSAK